MKFLFLVAALVAAASAVSYEDVFVQEFNLYKAQFRKSYKTPLENFCRMQIFLKNKYEVAVHNLKYQKGQTAYEMEINKFSDRLPEEFDFMNGLNKNLRGRAAAGKNVESPEGEVYSESTNVGEQQIAGNSLNAINYINYCSKILREY